MRQVAILVFLVLADYADRNEPAELAEVPIPNVD
jgi:hypothetical protein